MRILLVADDKILINTLLKKLADQNYTIDAVIDGEQGWNYASTYSYDLIILDWHLPKVDGINLCQRFRGNGYDVPILLLTTNNSSQEKTQALDAGADDCLDKPFQIEELNARIRALLRRYNSCSMPVLSWGELELDPCSCHVTYQGKTILLTNKEYQLLELFMRHSEEMFNIEDIIENIWSSVEYPSEATVRSHLRYLRQKLKQAGLPEDPIETLRGRGYCLKSLPQNYNNPANNLLVFPSAQEQEKQLQHLSALNYLWEKYQDKRKQKLTLLADTLKHWKEGNLEENQRQSAQCIAHQLTGNLRIFGFEEASYLTSELEQLLQENIHPETDNLLQFENIFYNLCQQLNFKDESYLPISSGVSLNFPLVLVIDDDQQFTELFSKLAFNEGIRVITIKNLQLAETWLQEVDKNRLPKIVLLKLAFNQWENQIICRYLSLINYLKIQIPSIPTIIMADRDEFSDRLLVTQKGGTFYLKKPVTPDEVLKFCHLALNRVSEDKKIMVVDNNEEFLRNLPNLLQPWGFNLTTLHDSRQFWDVLQAVEPDLLILNPEMPHINGVDLCTVIRSHPDWYNLRILYLSHNDSTDIKIKAVTSGTIESEDNLHNIQLLVDAIIAQFQSY